MPIGQHSTWSHREPTFQSVSELGNSRIRQFANSLIQCYSSDPVPAFRVVVVGTDVDVPVTADDDALRAVEGSLDAELIKSTLKDAFGIHAAPKEIIFNVNIPLISIGKPDRKKVQQLFEIIAP